MSNNLPTTDQRQERLEFLNYKRQEANNVSDLWGSRAQFILGAMGIILAAGLILRLFIFLFTGK